MKRAWHVQGCVVSLSMKLRRTLFASSQCRLGLTRSMYLTSMVLSWLFLKWNGPSQVTRLTSCAGAPPARASADAAAMTVTRSESVGRRMARPYLSPRSVAIDMTLMRSAAAALAVAFLGIIPANALAAGGFWGFGTAGQ